MCTLTDATRDYLIYLRVEQGAATSTVKTYGPHLRHFIRWMQDAGYPEPQLSDLTTPLIRRFLFHLDERDLRPMTVRNYLHALRGVSAYAVTVGLRADDPAVVVKMPKKDKPRRQTPNNDQVQALFDAVERDRNPRRIAQHRALLNVLVWGALRRAELLDLLVTDVNLDNRSLLVRRSKGGAGRTVFVPEQAVDALREWIAMRGACKHPYLFCADVNRRLHFKGLSAAMEDMAARAGLRDCEALKPHSLRHWRACDMLRANVDLKTISVALGHSNLATTSLYLHADEEQTRGAADRSCLKPKAEDKTAAPEPIPAAEPAPTRL
jgi:integrase/recombinase XerD